MDMNAGELEKSFKALYTQHFGENVDSLLPLAPSGSKRIYYRAKSKNFTAICAYNEDVAENKTFFYLSQHFALKKLPVPQIHIVSEDDKSYLQEDLDATTLYSFLFEKNDDFSTTLMRLYEQVVRNLAEIQIIGHEDLDYKKCFGIQAFNKQSILWDLNQFKYHFLKVADIPFDEVALETDFEAFADYLLQAPQDYFMFRDFQTRNIMIKNNKPTFIDYQGGRKGALQYDLASLLFQAKANLPHQVREHLLAEYLTKANEFTTIDRDSFKKYYYPYAMVRTMQVLGAYGFRGIFQRKGHFLESIPYAIKNMAWLLTHIPDDLAIPALRKVWKRIAANKKFDVIDKKAGKEALLSIEVKSFSYKKGIPKTTSSHGGGFVFDCRFLHNPGRYEPYKDLTGRDESVINFLQQHSAMPNFLNNVRHIVDAAVENYLDRSFDHLSIYFGCTGGKHRSVYAADQIANYLHDKYGIRITLQHRERGWKQEEIA
jgi:aminoglycoside/choline kinase family phosphotransferase